MSEASSNGRPRDREANHYLDARGNWIPRTGHGPYRRKMDDDPQLFEHGLASFLRLYDFGLVYWERLPGDRLLIRARSFEDASPPDSEAREVSDKDPRIPVQRSDPDRYSGLDRGHSRPRPNNGNHL